MGKVTPEMLRCEYVNLVLICFSECKRKSWWKLIVIGSMDSLGNVLGLIGAAHLDGPLLVLLPNVRHWLSIVSCVQGTILFTIFVSMIVLGQRYSRVVVQY